MQSITIICSAVLACAYAQDFMPYAEWYPGQYENPIISRHARDLSWERNAGSGKIFGTLGSTDDSLFGRGGYKQDIYNDHRGHLQGHAFGSRVLSPYGDSTSMGGGLNWSNDNGRLGAEFNKQIGGRSGMTITGDGHWNPGKNTRITAGGHVQKTFGHDRPDVGFQGWIEHKF